MSGSAETQSSIPAYAYSAISAAIPPPSRSPVRRSHSCRGQVRHGSASSFARFSNPARSSLETASLKRTFRARCVADARSSSTGCRPVTHMEPPGSFMTVPLP